MTMKTIEKINSPIAISSGHNHLSLPAKHA